MQVTNILEIVQRLDSFDDEATIYAVEPWTDQSAAIIAYEPDEGGVPAEAAALGMSYFIGVYTASEFLEGFVRYGDISGPGTPPYDWLKCARLIIYAIYDA